MGDRLVVCAALSLGACTGAAHPPAPLENTPVTAERTLQGAKLAGPYASIEAACQAATPCGATVVDDNGRTSVPPTQPDCGALASSPGLDHGDLRIAPVMCAAPEGLRDADAQYYAYVKRDDGWWRSGALFATSYNDKYCGGQLTATWDVHAPTVAARIAAEMECVACTKQGSQTTTTDLLLAVDATGAAPAVWGPLVVGEHYVKAPGPDAASDVACAREHRDAALAASWLAPDLLELAGPAKLATPEVEHGVLHIADVPGGGADGPSAVGRWRLAR